MVQVSMQELLEAGVHFGHQTRRWNPKMKRYIFGKRNGIYIIDLQKSRDLFDRVAPRHREVSNQLGSALEPGDFEKLQEISERIRAKAIEMTNHEQEK